MSYENITIAIDTMGGENAPLKNLRGVEIFSNQNPKVKILLIGKQELLKKSIKSNQIKINNYEIIHTKDNIEDTDNVSTILRNKKDNSISKGLEIVKDLNMSGFVSAGSTAALMILSRLKLGMIEGIDRPAICSIIPNNNNFSIMLDLGANSTVLGKNLLQFAIMGFCYHSILKPNKDPNIGIINIGTEDNKGLEFLQEASDLINDSFLKKYFKGFIEPNKITSGECDILVSDGYTGNIILKTAEGMPDFITGNLRTLFTKSLVNKVTYKILEKDFNKFKDQINPEKYNGAIFLGVNGVAIKSHGSATPYAFSHAIERCYDYIKNDINSKIRENFLGI